MRLGWRQKRRFAPKRTVSFEPRSSRWAKYLGIPLLGAACASALPPVYALPMLLVGFSGLLLLLRGDRGLWEAGRTGWLFGLGYFLAGLYWIGDSFLVDADRMGWLGFPAVLALSAFLAAFPALAAVASRVLVRLGCGEAASLAVAWTASEWLRGTVLTGFPWNLIGHVWSFADSTLQGAALVGPYGLGLLTVLAAAMPGTVWRSGKGVTNPAVWVPLGLSFVFPAVLAVAGEVRLQNAVFAEDPEIRLRVVQGNVPRSLQWQPAEKDRIIQRYEAFSGLAGPSDIKLLIWPETAVPLALGSDVEQRRAIASILPSGAILLTGAVRYSNGSSGPGRVHNSLLAISADAEVLASYDKVLLLPFDEYLPLGSYLPFKKSTDGRMDFAPGAEPGIINLPNVPPFQPLICYEAMFPDWKPESGTGAARWLLNVTDDAWLGISTGPYQHFQMARMRAVERGLPLVRAANSGISAIVDPLGRVTGRLDLGETGTLDSALPAPLVATPLYGRSGDLIVLAMGLIALVVSFVMRRLTHASYKFRN